MPQNSPTGPPPITTVLNAFLLFDTLGVCSLHLEYCEMSDGVKRPYNSVLRDEQAQATRRAVVKAAGRLFVERGYGATTIDAIAEEAGVGRKTVFTSIGGKAQALKLAIDWAIVGDDEPVALLDRAVVRAGMADPDPRHILAGFVHSLRE